MKNSFIRRRKIKLPPNKVLSLTVLPLNAKVSKPHKVRIGSGWIFYKPSSLERAGGISRILGIGSTVWRL